MLHSICMPSSKPTSTVCVYRKCDTAVEKHGNNDYLAEFGVYPLLFRRPRLVFTIYQSSKSLIQFLCMFHHSQNKAQLVFSCYSCGAKARIDVYYCRIRRGPPVLNNSHGLSGGCHCNSMIQEDLEICRFLVYIDRVLCTNSKCLENKERIRQYFPGVAANKAILHRSSLLSGYCIVRLLQAARFVSIGLSTPCCIQFKNILGLALKFCTVHHLVSRSFTTPICRIPVTTLKQSANISTYSFRNFVMSTPPGPAADPAMASATQMLEENTQLRSRAAEIQVQLESLEGKDFQLLALVQRLSKILTDNDLGHFNQEPVDPRNTSSSSMVIEQMQKLVKTFSDSLHSTTLPATTPILQISLFLVLNHLLSNGWVQR